MTASHGDIQQLSNEAVGALVSLGEWLWEAGFEDVDGIPICKKPKELREEAADFLKLFTKEAGKPSGQETRITAIHFRDSLTFPVPQDSTVDLIPVRHVGNTQPFIAGKEVKLGFFVHLTQDTNIQPEFYAILLLSQTR
ncbi:hypothetical protein CEP54_010365 [Fusarium duplospermum]|uniref:Uncharacterized protein n=1 Tax=Fusarium duplospermum TaxID=1325734 RepID=A0A428PKC8_9HYPO|nr:hypothetical protein CEP54_010365 [Fusarium duplospermum]